jgi:hypothetical protein
LDVKTLARGILAVSLVWVCGCSAQADLATAETEVAHFHQQLNEGVFSQIYADASEGLKKSAKEADFEKLLTSIHTKLGSVRQSKRTNWNVNFHTAGTFVTLVYDTEFERGKGTEQFVYLMSGKKAVLHGYHINSNDLVDK